MPSLRPILALLVAALLALPAGAQAQSPFAPLPQPRQEPPPAPTVTNPRDDDGLTAGQTILILVAAGGLLSGIAFMVVRDARNRAPVVERDGRLVADDAESRQRSHEEHRKAKARNRAAAKRARAARKKNAARRR